MKQGVDVAPNNSVILIMDRSVGEVPDAMRGKLVAATSSCIAIGTLSEHDGETSIFLSDEGRPSGMDNPVFEGTLYTPSRVISVCSTLGVILLEMPVISDRIRVQIWANDAIEPDTIEIVTAH